MQFDFKPTQKRKSPFSRPQIKIHDSSEKMQFSLPFQINTRIIASVLFFSIGFLCICASLLHLWALRFGWNKETPYGFVMLTQQKDNPVRKHVSVVWIDPRKTELRIIRIPDQIEVRIDRFGAYPISSIPGLFAQEKLPKAKISQVMSLVLGLHLRGVIDVHQEGSTHIGTVRSGLVRSLLSSAPSLSYADRIAVTEYTIASNRRVVEEEVPLALFEEKKVGNEIRYVIDSPRYQSWLDKRVLHDDIVAGNITLAVVNASGIRGAGATVGKYLERMGYTVLSISDTPEPLQTGVLTLEHESVRYVHAIQTLQALFGIDHVINAEETARKRSKAILYLGKENADLIPRHE